VDREKEPDAFAFDPKAVAPSAVALLSGPTAEAPKAFALLWKPIATVFSSPTVAPVPIAREWAIEGAPVESLLRDTSAFSSSEALALCPMTI
jgi:hypothetical protein